MIYLDNAATSFPKPAEVYTSIEKAAVSLSGNPSRSGHWLSQKSGEAVYLCRESIASFFNGEAENVVFTVNATYALNIAIKGCAKDGDHFIISNIEHNAVLRPINKLCEEKGCSYDIIDVIDQKDYEIISEIQRKIKKNTRAVIINHISNLCEIKSPIHGIGSFCKKKGLVFIVDASQSAGHIRIDMKSDNINFLCAPAHKGLFGVMGLGFLISDGEYQLESLCEGGSGYNSSDIHMPKKLPERLEAGTLPVPAISALYSGISFIKRVGIDSIRKHEEELFVLCRERLETLKKIKIYRKEYAGACILFNIDGIPSDIVGEYLADRDICVRSGFHCAPLAHKSISTGDFGAVRLSFGFFNTKRDIDLLYFAIEDFLRTR